jgi:hypothetical protein
MRARVSFLKYSYEIYEHTPHAEVERCECLPRVSHVANPRALICVRIASVYSEQMSSPKTCSLWPAKSMVLTPRTCCWIGPANVALVAAAIIGRAPRDEVKFLRWKLWEGSFCLEAPRSAFVKPREAIVICARGWSMIRLRKFLFRGGRSSCRTLVTLDLQCRWGN